MGLALYSFWTELIHTMKTEMHKTDLKEEGGNSPHSLSGESGPDWEVLRGQVGGNIKGDYAVECHLLSLSWASQQQVDSGLE